jgi:hypothetical protein
MVAWIAAVARTAARAPLGRVDAREVAVVLVAVVLLARFRRIAVAVALVLLIVLGRPPHGALADVDLARGAHLWRSGGVVLVLDGDVDSGRLLDALRRAGVSRIDLVIARRGTKTVGGVLVDLRARVPIGSVVAPADNRIRDATAVAAAATTRVGGLTVRLTPSGDALDVDIGETAGRGGGAG